MTNKPALYFKGFVQQGNLPDVKQMPKNHKHTSQRPKKKSQPQLSNSPARRLGQHKSGIVINPVSGQRCGQRYCPNVSSVVEP
jgi:hypothetical protein